MFLCMSLWLILESEPQGHAIRQQGFRLEKLLVSGMLSHTLVAADSESHCTEFKCDTWSPW